MKKLRLIGWVGFVTFSLIYLSGAAWALHGKGVFAPEVEKILNKKIKLIEHLSQDKPVVDAVKAANQEGRGLSLPEILRQDQRWREAGRSDPFIRSLLANACTQHLIDFQETQEVFPEIFVTDQRGLVVGLTNRTSDYYQADEDWWVHAYAEGKGESYHGEIEYDESAKSEAIALYVPVRDPESGQTIGVVKAILDLTEIMMQL